MWLPVSSLRRYQTPPPSPPLSGVGATPAPSFTAGVAPAPERGAYSFSDSCMFIWLNFILFQFTSSENNREFSPKKHKKDSHDNECIKGTSRDINEHPQGSSKNDKIYESCWMAPLIRVRIISKNFKKGNYYHKKVFFS